MDQTWSSFFPWKKETNQSETCPLLRILHFWNVSLPLKMRFLLGNEGLSSLNALSKWVDRVLAISKSFSHVTPKQYVACFENIYLPDFDFWTVLYWTDMWKLLLSRQLGKNKMRIFRIAIVLVCWVLWVTLRLGAYEGTFTWADIFLQNFCRVDYLHLCRAKRWQNIRCIARLSAVSDRSLVSR